MTWLLDFATSRLGRALGAVAAIAALLMLGRCVHQGKVEDLVETTRRQAIAERDAQWQGAFDKMRGASRQWRANYETTSAALSAEIGKRHAQDLRDNRDRADALLLRGPGIAAAAPGCGRRGGAQLSSASGGHPPPDGGGNAPLAPVPADEPLALVPWGELVRRARDADDDRAEVEAWRRWHAEQKALHDDAVNELQGLVPVFGQDGSGP